MRPKIGDIFVYIFIIVLVGLSFLGLKTMGNRGDRKMVQIELDGEIIESVEMSETEPEGTTREIRIDTGDGGYNIVRISAGDVGITDANCPDRLCVISPRINTPGQSIVCIPHRLIVRIIGREPEDGAVDDTAS
ncbi:MAG TPA: NusG domain II-containing protein [Clostridia bacterium]|nr:NusG domain II-containing protein [Clostridia bacterium]